MGRGRMLTTIASAALLVASMVTTTTTATAATGAEGTTETKCAGKRTDVELDRHHTRHRGTNKSETVLGGHGAHRIVGRGGNDRLCGGRGDDYLHGGSGRDILQGGEHDDRLVGGTGSDVLNAGPGSDSVNARDGESDRVSCGSGNDSARVDRSDTVVACERVARTEAPEPESATPDFALPSWGDGLWDAPSTYLTIQTADVNGDGDDELLGRSSQGLELHEFDVESGQWIEMPDGDGIDLADDQNYDLAIYYSVIQAADFVGDRAEELLVRTQAGMQVWSYDRDAHVWTPLTQGLGMMVGNWDMAKYRDTIQADDVDGDGDAELLGRGELGMLTAALEPDTSTPVDGDYVWQSQGNGASPFPNSQGWDQPQYYDTIQTADLDGDGDAELLGRAQGGLDVYEWDGGWVLLPGATNPIFSSGGADKSWDQPAFYSTISSGNFSPQLGATAQMWAYGPQGLEAYRYYEDDRFWGALNAAGNPLPAGAWSADQYGSTLQAADVDGDGIDELIGRASDGIRTWRYDDAAGWSPIGSPLTSLSDSEGWDEAKYYATIQTADVHGDGSREILGRGATGIRTFGSTDGEWGSTSTPFPSFTSPGQAAAFKAINSEFGGRTKPDFDIRDQYPSASGADLTRWSDQLDRMPAPSDATPADWNAVKGQLTNELDDALVVQDWFDNYLNGLLLELFVAKNMDSTAQLLDYNTTAKTELTMAQWELFAGVFEAVAEVTGIATEVEAASLLAGILATGLSSRLEFSGIARVEEVRGKYLEVQGELQASFNQAIAAPRFMREAVMSDYGLLDAVGSLIGEGAWERLSAAGQKEAQNRGLRAYSISVWQTITPAIWTKFQYADPDGCPTWGDVCDYKAGGLAWTLFDGTAKDLHGDIAPSGYVDDELREKLFEETDEGECLEASGSWNSASCAIGLDKHDLFLGPDWQFPVIMCSGVSFVRCYKQ